MDNSSTKTKIWLSLSEAAGQLGVHFTTLRRWADAGDIECMRTPGGRRRFRADVIQQFLQQHQHPFASNLPAIVGNRLIGHTRRDLQVLESKPQPWVNQFTAEQKSHFRTTGSRLTALLLQYSHRPHNGEAFIEEGKRLTADYGIVCYNAGLSFPQTIRAFLFFQRSILNAVHETGFLGEVDASESQRLYQRVSFFFDEMLIALVSQYVSLSTIHPSPIESTGTDAAYPPA